MAKKNHQKNIKKETQSMKNPINEHIEHLQRLQAEFINFRNRVEKEKQDIKQYAKEDFIIKLLDVIDNFERAIDSMENAKDVGSCKQGVKLIFNQLNEILESEGVKKIEARGKEFDPYIHEAIEKISSKEKENIILDEIQKGYKFKERVIRPSKVKVSGGKKNE